MIRYMMAAMVCAACAAMQAQTGDQVRRASISGSRGTSGKCTIEVQVDGSAEVDIYGDSGRLRTIAGQPAMWRRLDCTDALPVAMSDVRFKGISGRGETRLIRDPRNANGVATIRIDDTKGGAEGYTFEIEWSGASAAGPVGGFGTYPASGTDRGMRRAGDWSRRTTFSAERAIDACRNEVRTRAGRDYGLEEIDFTSMGIDTAGGRQDLVTGTFAYRGRGYRRDGGYRFNCSVDYSSGQVRTVELLQPDGSIVRPASTSNPSSTYFPNVYNGGTYDRNRIQRACQDAVVTRINRNGYESVRFATTAIDASRAERVTGTAMGSRGSITDTFDFVCAMDSANAQVRQVDVTRR